MTVAQVDFLRVDDVDAAVEALWRLGTDAKVLAGGQSLGPMLNYRLIQPGVLVDVSRIPALRGITPGVGAVSIGAAVTQAEILSSAELAAATQLLVQATHHVAHPSVRERGTIGGSLAHNDPAGEYASVLLALDATVRIRSSRGSREQDIAGLVEERFLETSIEPDELLVEIVIPRRGLHTGHGFNELAERVGDYAIAGAAATVTLDPGSRNVTAARLCGIGGLYPLRLRSAEDVLVGGPPSAERLREAARTAADEYPAGDDIHATAGYRRTLFATLALRALAEARAAAGA